MQKCMHGDSFRETIDAGEAKARYRQKLLHIKEWFKYAAAAMISSGDSAVRSCGNEPFSVKQRFLQVGTVEP